MAIRIPQRWHLMRRACSFDLLPYICMIAVEQTHISEVGLKWNYTENHYWMKPRKPWISPNFRRFSQACCLNCNDIDCVFFSQYRFFFQKAAVCVSRFSFILKQRLRTFYSLDLFVCFMIIWFHKWPMKVTNSECLALAFQHFEVSVRKH